MAAEMDVDKVVLKTFFKDKQEPGVFVEIGAARPDYLSISASYRKLMWKIISIEPNPDFCKLHRDMGLDVYEYACSDHDQDNTEFFIVDSKGANYQGGNVSFESFSSLGINDEFSTLYDTVKNDTQLRKILVKVRRLDTILAEHEPDIKNIDIVAVDVEGWEMNVMQGFSTEKFRPRVIILENLFNKQEYVDYMKSRGYGLWKRLEPNDVYVELSLLKSKSSLISRLRSFFGV